MTDLTVKTRVSEAQEVNYVVADFYEVLDEKVEEILEDAASCEGVNDRGTAQSEISDKRLSFLGNRYPIEPEDRSSN